MALHIGQYGDVPRTLHWGRYIFQRSKDIRGRSQDVDMGRDSQTYHRRRFPRRTLPRGTPPRQTFARPDTSPMDISPTRHIPDRLNT